jgi:hypothetical protein
MNRLPTSFQLQDKAWNYVGTSPVQPGGDARTAPERQLGATLLQNHRLPVDTAAGCQRQSTAQPVKQSVIRATAQKMEKVLCLCDISS